MENTVGKKHVRAVARAGPVLRAVARMALAVLACAVLAGCSKATKHKDVKYNIYIGDTHLSSYAGDSNYSKIYVYDADSLTLIDSFPQPDYINQLAVSPDGRWLYTRNGPYTPGVSPLRKINARTGQIVWSHTTEVARSKRSFVQILGNGDLLLSGNDVLRAEDGILVRHLDDSLFIMHGPASDTKVATAIRQSSTWTVNDSIIRVVDIATGEVSGRFVAHLTSGVPLQQIFAARLHPDGRRILAIGIYRNYDNTWFVVGDIVTGQTLFEQEIYRHLGEIAISSDGNLAAFTDPGMRIIFEGGGAARVIDLRTLSLIPPGPLANGGQVHFLPGDRRIITAPASDFLSPGSMLVFNLATKALEKTILLPMPNPYRAGGMDMGPRQ